MEKSRLEVIPYIIVKSNNSISTTNEIKKL